MTQSLRVGLSVLGLALFVSCSVPAPWSPDQERAPVREKERNSSARPSIAFGEISYDVDGAPESTNDAALYQIALEFAGPAVGGGFRLWGAVSDDDGTIFGPTSESDTDMFGFYAHFTGEPSAGPVDIPIRGGLVFDWSLNESNRGFSQSEILYTHIGAKLEVMPEVHIDFTEGLRVTFFAGGQLGVASTIVSAETPILNEDDLTESWLYGFETGVRVTGRGFGGSVGYVNRTWDIDSVTFNDATIPITFADTTQAFDGIMIAGYLSW